MAIKFYEFCTTSAQITKKLVLNIFHYVGAIWTNNFIPFSNWFLGAKIVNFWPFFGLKSLITQVECLILIVFTEYQSFLLISSSFQTRKMIYLTHK